MATATKETLYHLAFDNAAQASIIIEVSNGKIILANNTTCNLLGYSKKEMLTQNRSTIFAINERSFKKMMKQKAAVGKATALVTAIKKSGKLIPCEISSAVFVDTDGIEKSITSITDMSQIILHQKNIDAKKEKIVADNIVLALSKSETRLAENNEWIKYIAKASYDVMWDWDIASGEIYVGDSIEEVFGYKIRNNITNFEVYCSCLLPEEKESIEKKIMQTLASASKSWDDAYMFLRRNGSIASTTSRGNIVRDETGKAIRMIGAIQDVSRLHELEKKMEQQINRQQLDVKKEETVAGDSVMVQQKSDIRLAENNQTHNKDFSLAAKLSFDVIWDWNLLTNKFFLGEGFEELFGYAVNNKDNPANDWSNYLHPDDKKVIKKSLQVAVTSSATYWEHFCSINRADGSTAKIFCRANIIRHAGGKASRMIGVIHDLSKQAQLEDDLAHAIKLKEKQITDASEDARETERSHIGKELHDNINQLLVASNMYIQMAKRGGDNRELYLNRSSEYTVSAVEEIRKLTKGLTTDIIKNLGLCEAINKIARDTMEIHPVKISCALASFKEKAVNDTFKLNVFRIVQEQLNNILKHAKAKKILIGLSENKKSIHLTISDNGIGFDTIKMKNGIGIDNIKSRAASFNGAADFVSQPGKGCVLTVTFPLTERQ